MLRRFDQSMVAFLDCLCLSCVTQVWPIDGSILGLFMFILCYTGLTNRWWHSSIVYVYLVLFRFDQSMVAFLDCLCLSCVIQVWPIDGGILVLFMFILCYLGLTNRWSHSWIVYVYLVLRRFDQSMVAFLDCLCLSCVRQVWPIDGGILVLFMFILCYSGLTNRWWHSSIVYVYLV